MRKLALAATVASAIAASASAQQVTFVDQVLPERFRDNVKAVTELYAQVHGEQRTSRRTIRAFGGLDAYAMEQSRPAVERELRAQFPTDLPGGKYFFVLDRPEVTADSELLGLGHCALLSAGSGAGAGVALGFILAPQEPINGNPTKAANDEVRNGVIGGAVVGLGVLAYCLATDTTTYVEYDVSQSGILYRVTE